MTLIYRQLCSSKSTEHQQSSIYSVQYALPRHPPAFVTDNRNYTTQSIDFALPVCLEETRVLHATKDLGKQNCRRPVADKSPTREPKGRVSKPRTAKRRILQPASQPASQSRLAHHVRRRSRVHPDLSGPQVPPSHEAPRPYPLHGPIGIHRRALFPSRPGDPRAHGRPERGSEEAPTPA